MLMCQLFSPYRVRTDQFAKSGEMWPGHERANTASPRVHSPRGSSPRVVVSAQSSPLRGRDASGALLAFVRQHLSNFLQIACLAFATEPATVGLEELDVLGLILCAGNSLSQPLSCLSEAVPELLVQETMPLKELTKELERLLVWNEEVYSMVEVGPGAQGLPEGRPRTINISGMNKATWFHRPESGETDFLNITSCTDCVIYVTFRTRFCLIAGCHDCTIIMGPVSTLCTINSCEKMSVHVAAHCFKMENSIDSSAYVFCHLPPILTGDTRGIKLAPFNVLYSEMSEMLQSAEMSLDPEHVDSWAHPVCCTLGAPDETLCGRSGSLDEPNHSTYHFVHPMTFQPVIVPESGAAPLASPQLCLPQAYDDVLKERVEEMRAFQSEFAELSDPAVKRRAQQAIQGHFREWLQSTGRSRQLADLARLGQPGKS